MIENPTDHDVGEKVLSARSLVYSYGTSPALRGLSLEIGQGEMVAVSGPSGSGKSTLLLCLAGVLVPDAGTVSYNGSRISDSNERTRSRLRRGEFGVLFQFGQLVPELTTVENVALPLLLGGSRRRSARTAALTWMERFDVAELADRQPPEISGGQQQRVALARAMVTEPGILFTDEPTGALDLLASEKVMAHLTRVTREARTTVVIVTHDPLIAAYADREVVVRDGVIDAAAVTAQ